MRQPTHGNLTFFAAALDYEPKSPILLGLSLVAIVLAMVDAPIAQLDRASDYGSEGWGFKSSWVYAYLAKEKRAPRMRGFFFLPSRLVEAALRRLLRSPHEEYAIQKVENAGRWRFATPRISNATHSPEHFAQRNARASFFLPSRLVEAALRRRWVVHVSSGPANAGLPWNALNLLIRSQK